MNKCNAKKNIAARRDKRNHGLLIHFREKFFHEIILFFDVDDHVFRLVLFSFYWACDKRYHFFRNTDILLEKYVCAFNTSDVFSCLYLDREIVVSSMQFYTSYFVS